MLIKGRFKKSSYAGAIESTKIYRSKNSVRYYFQQPNRDSVAGHYGRCHRYHGVHVVEVYPAVQRAQRAERTIRSLDDWYRNHKKAPVQALFLCLSFSAELSRRFINTRAFHMSTDYFYFTRQGVANLDRAVTGLVIKAINRPGNKLLGTSIWSLFRLQYFRSLS